MIDFQRPCIRARNSLPFSVVTSPSVNSFKNRLDNHWASQDLDMIGKQNYQELGVEAELNFELFEFTIIYSK